MSDHATSVLFDDNDPPLWRLEPPRDPDVVCEGVPTDSVLGLLCALGTLFTLDRAWPDKGVRMAWQRSGAAWKPCLWVCERVLSGDNARRQQQVVQALHGYLTRTEMPWWSFADDPKMPCSTFLAKAQEVSGTTSHRSRDFADWLAAYGCEVFASSPREDILDSELNMMRRASQQLFLKSMRELAACTTPEDIRRALFSQWLYADPKPYLRLDYRDDRSLAAYRAYDPQDRDGREAMSPILTVRGANRLAAEAMPLLPTAPSARSISTVAFARCDGESFFRFPLWDRPLTCPSVKCFLNHPEMTEELPKTGVLRSLGVVAMLQARRNQSDKGGRSFLPVEQLW
jgi:hypothetical protein